MTTALLIILSIAVVEWAWLILRLEHFIRQERGDTA